MSSELDDQLLDTSENLRPSHKLEALLNVDGNYTLVPLLAAEIDDAGNRIIIIDSMVFSEKLLGLFITREEVDLVIMGQEFRTIVMRVDYNRSYLRILEQ